MVSSSNTAISFTDPCASPDRGVSPDLQGAQPVFKHTLDSINVRFNEFAEYYVNVEK